MGVINIPYSGEKIFSVYICFHTRTQSSFLHINQPPSCVSEYQLRIQWTVKELIFFENGPSEKWWRGFKACHPQLLLLRADVLDRECSSNSNIYVVRDYFKLLDKVLFDNDLKQRPDLVYNCEETATDLNKSTQRVIVPVRQKHAHLRDMGATQYISVHC